MKKKKSPKTEKTDPKNAPKNLRKVVLISTVVGLLLFGAASAGAYQITQLPESAFVKYFYVEGVELDGVTTFEEAEKRVLEQVDAFLTAPVTFTSERGNLTTTLKDAGINMETNAALAELSSFMATSSSFEKIRSYLLGQDLTLPLTYDETALKITFAGANIEQGLKNASYQFQGNTVVIDSEQIGYGIDTTTLASNIEVAWRKKLTTIDLPLLTSTPTVTSDDLQPLLAEAQAASALEFTLMDEFGTEYPLPMSEHLNWLIPGSTRTFGIQQEAFISTIQTELAIEVEEDPQPVIITENEDGSYAFEGSARFGQKVDTLALAEEFESALEFALHPIDQEVVSMELQIPITRVLPEVTVPDSLKAMGVTDLVGVGYSDFSGSPSNRIHNINVGIAQFNGVLIAQGAEFSFMEQLSEVDAAHGFLPELVIKGDETIPEYGGGMCQVSSTMFRAALYSGLPITARTNHSYAVSYYARPFGYGLDATVYDPAPDLKFLNDTPGALLVQAYTEGSSAFYVFYGTNDSRRVTMDGPRAYDYRSIPADVITYTDELAPGERRLKEYGHQGFKVDWTRTITRADGTTTSETIHSNYEARPEKWEEGKAVEETVAED